MIRLSKLSEGALNPRKAFYRGGLSSQKEVNNNFKINCRKDT